MVIAPVRWKVRWTSVMQNMILAQLNASWRRQRLFLLDGIVRGTPATPNINLACWSCTVEDTFPDGWSNKREASNKQHDIGAIDDQYDPVSILPKWFLQVSATVCEETCNCYMSILSILWEHRMWKASSETMQNVFSVQKLQIWKLCLHSWQW